MAVVVGKDFFGAEPGTVIGSLKPFTPTQLSLIRTLAPVRARFVAFAPGGPNRLQWRQLARSTPEAFCTTYRYNVCPPTDNQPFFFNMKRLSQIFQPLPAVYSYTVDPYMVLGITLLILIALSPPGLRLAFGPRPQPITSAGGFPALLRCHRARVPDHGDRDDRVVRALPGVPPVFRPYGGALLAAPLHRGRGALIDQVGPAGGAPHCPEPPLRHARHSARSGWDHPFPP